jgi:hypothetical protein
MALHGLDRATAPSPDQAKRMLAEIGGRWWNVYIGGPESGGHGWTPALVADYVRHGIERFMLTYVGRQKAGPLTAAQGRADGRDALDLARSFGYTGDFPLCLDVEQPTFDHAPGATVAYAKAWCATVKKAGARPGVYSNAAPLKRMATDKVPADFVWVASWLGHSAVAARDPHAIPNFPNDLWSKPGQRAWQYAGAFGNKPCRVLGLDVDIDVADPGCLAGPPGVQAGPSAPPQREPVVLRLGDEGPRVRRLTRRLSFVRSRSTHKPYLDGARRDFDQETARALKAFQREHGLDDDGKFGKLTRHKLAKAVETEKKRREQIGATPSPGPAHETAPGKKPKVDVALLAERAIVTDRKADTALEDLLAYGLRRRRLLQRLEAQQAMSTQGLLLQIIQILKQIEDDVDDFGEAAEYRQASPAAHDPATATPTATEEKAATATEPKTVSEPEPAPVLLKEMDPIPHPPPEGPAPVPAHDGHPPAGGLVTMADRDVALLIREHGAAIDAARAELVKRFERYDAAIAKLRPPAAPGTRPSTGDGRPPIRPDKPPAPGKPAKPGKPTKPGKGSVADIRLGDEAHIVRASKLALARFLAAKGSQEHVKTRRALRREARLRKRGEIATRTWLDGVRAAQHLTGSPVTGVLDGALQDKLKPYWPSDSAVRKFMRATPAWRLIKGQVSPNFNLREFGCKDGTPYVTGLMREQQLSKSQAKQRARELAKRLERVRKAGGGARLGLNSVFRTKAHNAAVGGEPNSAHLRGFAADIPPQAGVSLVTHRQHVRSAFEAGCGFYPGSNFVHGDFDMTLGRREWNG